MGVQCTVLVVLLADLHQYFSSSGSHYRRSLPHILSVPVLQHLLAVRRHINQIQALQVQQTRQNDEMANAARLRKSAVGTFYVYLVFLLCNLPQFCIFAVVEISGLNTGVKVFFIFSTTLLFLNSSLNPVIYCWKIRQIRRAVFDFLRNIFRSHE